MKNQPCTSTAPHSTGDEVALTQTSKLPARNQSVRTLISLPEGSRVRDVANVIGLLSGLTFTQVWGCHGNYLRVQGVSISPACPPGEAEIEIRGNLIGGPRVRSVTFCFDHPHGLNQTRYISPISSPYWLAVGQGLIKAFGGKLVFRTDRVYGHFYPKSRRQHNVSTADQYLAFQRELYAVPPITVSDLDDMRPYAAYPDPDR